MPSTGGKNDPGDNSCANCSGPADDLEEVRRVYLTFDADGRPTGSETVETIEIWCRACRTLYPHEARGSS
ncbi:MAG TPA: hypothetical protein VID75_11230 [Acidimicrobiales bacterium]|jgi:hypothetical protein